MKNIDPLCCCEYINQDNERSHVLGCCCNCEDLDIFCERLVCCNRVSRGHLNKIMSVMYDRLRIPWRGGAKQISVDSLLPIIVQPMLMYLAALNMWFSIITFLIMVSFLWYMCFVFACKNPRTKFFCMWTIMSVILSVLVFEISVVPLLEILPEENITFIVFSLLSLFCTYKVWSLSSLNKVNHNDRSDDLCGKGKATELVCSVCRKRVPPRTYHCSICQTCILCKDHHCMWLDCCIGEKNKIYFLLVLIFSLCAIFDGAYLTLTSVCHPIFVLEYVLIPDDCSDVYHDFEIALCFVSALYGMLAAMFILFHLVHYCWLISLGLTKQEWQELSALERRFLGLRSSRPYNKGLVRNWVNFVCHCCRSSSTSGC